jgi:hypothetical protein
VEAQRLYDPRGVRNYHGHSDYSNAITLLGYLVESDEELKLYFRLLKIRARQYLQRFWIDVEALADALLKKKHLTGQEVRAIVARKI